MVKGGNIIGPDPAGNVLIIDDVLSAGTAARESIKILENFNAAPKIFLLAWIDKRKEKLSYLQNQNLKKILIFKSYPL